MNGDRTKLVTLLMQVAVVIFGGGWAFYEFALKSRVEEPTFVYDISIDFPRFDFRLGSGSSWIPVTSRITLRNTGQETGVILVSTATVYGYKSTRIDGLSELSFDSTGYRLQSDSSGIILTDRAKEISRSIFGTNSVIPAKASFSTDAGFLIPQSPVYNFYGVEFFTYWVEPCLNFLPEFYTRKLFGQCFEFRVTIDNSKKLKSQKRGCKDGFEQLPNRMCAKIYSRPIKEGMSSSWQRVDITTLRERHNFRETLEFRDLWPFNSYSDSVCGVKNPP